MVKKGKNVMLQNAKNCKFFVWKNLIYKSLFRRTRREIIRITWSARNIKIQRKFTSYIFIYEKKQIYFTFRYVDKRHGWTVGRANRVLGRTSVTTDITDSKTVNSQGRGWHGTSAVFSWIRSINDGSDAVVLVLPEHPGDSVWSCNGTADVFTIA